MKNAGKTKATRAFASLFAGILAVSSSTYAVVNAQRSVIDANLGISSYKVVTDTDASDDNLYGITAGAFSSPSKKAAPAGCTISAAGPNAPISLW